MTTLSFQQFDLIYQESVNTVFQHWTREMQEELATHCHSWSPESFDFRNYLEVSSIRFFKAYRSFAKEGIGPRVCDVGGFWGVFPLTLKKLGFDVAMTESLQYYGDSFNGLFQSIRDHGVTIFDYDPFQPGAALPAKFDVIAVMAVLEHYPHSHRQFMGNIKSLLASDGIIYIEVPNIAYWPKRIALMRGQTPLAQLSEVFVSDVPFIGHHHEFTRGELRDLARLSDLSITYEDFYNYTPGSIPSLKMLLRFPIQFLAFNFLKESRECLAITCKVLDEEKRKVPFMEKGTD